MVLFSDTFFVRNYPGYDKIVLRDFFAIIHISLVVRAADALSSKALMWSKLSSETLLQTRNCLTEFVIFLTLYLYKTFKGTQNLSQSKSCLMAVNLLWQCFSEVSEFFVRNLSVVRKTCLKINRPKFLRPNFLVSYV